MKEGEIRNIIRQELARARDNEYTGCDSCNGSGRQLDITSTSGDRLCGKCNGTGTIKNKKLWGYQKS